MILSFWNIRGCNKPTKQKGLVHFLRKHNINILVLLETKLNANMLSQLLLKFSSWKSVHNFDLHPGKRVLIIWNPSFVSLNVVASSAQSIFCNINCLVTGRLSHLTAVYAYNTLEDRRLLWDEIVDQHSHISSPWMVLGDFNCILNVDEREGGRLVSAHQLQDQLNCIMSCGLMDLRYMGCKFTWDNGTVRSKLDRVLVNAPFFECFPNATSNFLNSGCLSDHSPCIIQLMPIASSAYSFKFYNMWVKHEQFQAIVSNSWDVPIMGTSMFILCKKLKRLKRPLKELNRKDFSHISSRADCAVRDLDALQNQVSSNWGCPVWKSQLRDSKQKAFRLLEAERLYFSQMTKGSFLMLSDRNSKFYHSLIRRNIAKRSITCIKMSDGSSSTSLTQVADQFIDYYSSLLGSSSHVQCINQSIMDSGPKLSLSGSLLLVDHVSNTDIKNALFSIPNDKSPGPDGYSSQFFKEAWNIVGEDFTRAALEFFRNGRILKQINHTLIALIPKSVEASSVHDYRPISYCNVIYKIISKIFAGRLAAVMSEFVDHSQAGFLKGNL